MRRVFLVVLLSFIVLVSGCVSEEGSESDKAKSATPSIQTLQENLQEKLKSGIGDLKKYNLSMVQEIKLNISETGLLSSDFSDFGMGFTIAALVDEDKDLIVANLSLDSPSPFGFGSEKYLLYVNGSEAEIKPVSSGSLFGLQDSGAISSMVFKTYITQAKQILNTMFSENASITKNGSVYVVRGNLDTVTVKKLPNVKFEVSGTGTSTTDVTVKKAYFEATISENFDWATYTIHVEYGDPNVVAVYELRVELRELPDDFKINVPEEMREG